MILTPAKVEQRLMELSAEIDQAQVFLDKAEAIYYQAKVDCEIELAKSRLSLKKENKMTVQERADLATVRCQDLLRELAVAEATIKSARANSSRLRTQVDIIRSVGTSVRSAIDIT